MRCWWSRNELPALTLFALALLAGAGRPLAAQAPADRAALAALRDSLDAADTPARLETIPRDWSADASAAMERLRRGFHALAAGRISGKRADFDRALVEFDWAITVARHWPYPWYGRGLAKLALSEKGFRPKPLGGQPYGRNYYVGFTEDLIRAFEQDAEFEPGVALLLRLLPPQGDRVQPAAPPSISSSAAHIGPHGSMSGHSSRSSDSRQPEAIRVRLPWSAREASLDLGGSMRRPNRTCEARRSRVRRPGRSTGAISPGWPRTRSSWCSIRCRRQ
jgi:hypothetical protein